MLSKKTSAIRYKKNYNHNFEFMGWWGGVRQWRVVYLYDANESLQQRNSVPLVEAPGELGLNDDVPPTQVYFVIKFRY